MQDNSFSKILRALEYHPSLASLSYSNNSLGKESIEVLTKILNKAPPDHLRKLRLCNIKAKTRDLEELFKILEDLNYVKKLKLSHLPIKSNFFLFQSLKKIINNTAGFLLDLDISGLCLSPS